MSEMKATVENIGEIIKNSPDFQSLKKAYQNSDDFGRKEILVMIAGLLLGGES